MNMDMKSICDDGGLPGPHDPYDPSEDFHNLFQMKINASPIKGNKEDAKKHKKIVLEGWKYPWADLTTKVSMIKKLKK